MLKNLFCLFGGLKSKEFSGMIKKHGIGLGLTICKELVNF